VTTISPRPAEYVAQVEGAACRNCDAALAGPYCAACGQQDRDPDPSVRELAAEMVAEQLGVDGRLVATFRRLLVAPGQLTVDYLAGRRASLVSPLRIYLTCSVLFFAVAAVVPEPRRVMQQATHAGAPTDDREGTRLIEAKVAEMRRASSPVTRRLADNLERQLVHRAALERWKAGALPKLMFVLVPAFAALTALVLPRRRRFPAHLAFALHVHAFAFLALLLYEAGKLADRLDAIVAATAVSWTLMLGYLVLALRRAYALRAVPAIARATVICVAYYLLLTLAQALAIAIRAEFL
jgi:hypothetical protein